MRLRKVVGGFLTGALLVGSAWAGIGLAPIGSSQDAGDIKAGSGSDKVTEPTLRIASGEDLGADELLAGASKVSIEPNPGPDDVWERDKAKCLPAGTGGVDPQAAQTHVADWRNPWIENSNCIYMGGFGLGPSQPVLSWDQEYGLWARSAAFSKDGGTAILTILDGEGYFAKYNKMCGDTPCGSADLAKQLTAELTGDFPELGITPASFVFASTHAHSAMDFIGGWGGVPEWYMKQTAEAMRSSARQAVQSMVPATLEVGDTLARSQNGERRDTYWSAEDATVNWLRARARDGSVVTTLGSFAAHATSFGGSATKAHADWPGVFDKTVEDRWGGTGLMFEAGLGNMSTRGGHMMGKTLAERLPDVGGGKVVPHPTVRVQQTFWDQPVTNIPLGTLGAGGFFDRPFSGPATVEAGKSGVKPCRSAGPTSATVSTTAIRIGELETPDNPATPNPEPLANYPDVIITAAPGEIFANFSNTVEEQARLGAISIGQANDALGYMPQSFESDPPAREGPGFVGGGYFEYEDAYSIDLCFGDKALKTTLDMMGSLRSTRKPWVPAP